MKKTISPILSAGLIIFVAYLVIDRFIIPISDLIATPILILASILIFVGGIKSKRDNN